LDDTARVLVETLGGAAADLYLLDGNPGLSFWQIASALSLKTDGNWEVRPTGDFVWNNCLNDKRLGHIDILRVLRAG